MMPIGWLENLKHIPGDLEGCTKLYVCLGNTGEIANLSPLDDPESQCKQKIKSKGE